MKASGRSTEEGRGKDSYNIIVFGRGYKQENSVIRVIPDYYCLICWTMAPFAIGLSKTQKYQQDKEEYQNTVM